MVAAHNSGQGWTWRVHRAADGVFIGKLIGTLQPNGVVTFAPDAQLVASTGDGIGEPTGRRDGPDDLRSGLRVEAPCRKAQAKDAAAIEARVEELFAQIFTALVEGGEQDRAELPPA